MSKIQIEELSSAASEFVTLDNQETSEIVGGYYLYYSYPSFSVSLSSNYSSKAAVVEQVNLNSNAQIALGGGYYFTSNGNKNGGYQTNNVTVSQY